MNESFRMFPDAASRSAGEVDLLSLTLLGISVVFSVGIATAILVFASRYWHTRDVNREVSESVTAHWGLELLWSGIPLVILLVMFWWGADLYLREHVPTGNPIEISVVAKRWMWKIGHESGPREINTVHLPVGNPVRLTMISQDVVHSFYIPAFRTKHDVLPGRYTTLLFEPNQVGVYHLFCAEYCGTDHSRMIGKVIVQSPADYLNWETAQSEPSAAERGRRLLDASGCVQCHAAVGNRVGPRLTGLFGRTVTMTDGSRQIADAAYVRQSILYPQTQIRAGYQAVMPSFEGKLEQEQILEITAYLRSVKDADDPLAGPGPVAGLEQEGD